MMATFHCTSTRLDDDWIVGVATSPDRGHADILREQVLAAREV